MEWEKCLVKREQAKKKVEYGKNKKAFDQVLEVYVSLQGAGAVQAIDHGSGGKAAKHSLRPSRQDFKADVDIAIRKALAKVKLTFSAFERVYVNCPIQDEIEREVFYEKALGGRRHSFEQRAGAEFIRRDIYPTAEYFTVVIDSPPTILAGGSVLKPFKAAVPIDREYTRLMTLLNEPQAATGAAVA